MFVFVRNVSSVVFGILSCSSDSSEEKRWLSSQNILFVRLFFQLALKKNILNFIFQIYFCYNPRFWLFSWKTKRAFRIFPILIYSRSWTSRKPTQFAIVICHLVNTKCHKNYFLNNNPLKGRLKRHIKTQGEEKQRPINNSNWRNLHQWVGEPRNEQYIIKSILIRSKLTANRSKAIDLLGQFNYKDAICALLRTRYFWAFSLL